MLTPLTRPASSPATMLGRAGEFFGAFDASYRSSFSSSASASRYLVIDGYSLLNTRVGFRWSNDWALSVWVRNLLDEKYFELSQQHPAIPVFTWGCPAIRERLV